MKRFFQITRGTTLLEIILTVSIFAIVVPPLIVLALGGLKSSVDRQTHLKAFFLAQEGLEATRSIRDYDWSALVVGTHGLTDENGFWEWSGASDISLDGFVRTVEVSVVDPDIKRIISTVESPSGVSRQLSTLLTHWKLSDWIQTTVAHFNGGTRSNTVVTNASGGEVQLSPGASAGTFVSSAYDAGSMTADHDSLEWNRSGVGTLKFQLRTSDTQAGLGGAVWVGPDGTNATYYLASGLPIVLDSGRSGTRWIQFQAFFEGDGITTPVLNDLTVRYTP